MNTDFSPWALNILNQKYAHTLRSGRKETWNEIANRVTSNVLGAVDAPDEMIKETTKAIRERKFLPGGRYLYASGRALKQTQNCLLLRADDSREGWSELMHKASMSLMTGAGIGVVYSDVREEGALIRRTGGTATGPCALMQMVNEAGRYIMQGGSRRSAIWAGLHWNHPDVVKFAIMKDWIPEVRALKEKDFHFPAPMDGTNISVILDDTFFKAYHDKNHRHHSLAHNVYWTVIRRMLKTGEPGFSVDVGANTGENLRNAPVCGDTMVLTDKGYQSVLDLVGMPSNVWTGKQFAKDVVFKQTNHASNVVRVSITGGRDLRCDPEHPFFVEKWKGAGSRRKMVGIERVPAAQLSTGDVLHVSMNKPEKTWKSAEPNSYALGYIYGDGSFGQSGNAEVTFRTDESKSCAPICAKADLFSSATETDGRGYTRMYFRTNERWQGRSKCTFPSDMFLSSPYEAASFLAGLFDSDGNWEPSQKRIRLASKHEKFLRNVSLLLEQLGILSGVSRSGISTYGKAQRYQLVIMSDYNERFANIIPCTRIKPVLDGYCSYRKSTLKVLSVESDGIEPVYCADVGVEEHSFQAEGVIVSNCTEVTSQDDSDICNLGSLNLARIESLEEMERLTEIATAFLLAGTVYSDVPYSKVDEIRRKNRRLGLGLMGVSEWLLKNGKNYAPDEELAQYLNVYLDSDEHASKYAKKWRLSVPKKTRAIAPTGTIGIIAETTTGIEPIFCVAYKRRYQKGKVTHYQYVVDPCAKRLIESGISPESIEDAYSLAENVEKRVAFQAWVQKYVDHGISSTINLPAWGSRLNNEGKVQGFGDMLIKYLPELRGITCYPDGARGGQPLTPIKFTTAMQHVGEDFVEEQADVCDITKSGSCGS